MIGVLTFDDVTVLDTVDSTNDAAKRRLGDGVSTPFVISAREQRHGRGRAGRAWKSRPGNLAATFHFPFEGTHQDAARLSFGVSLAVRDTLLQQAPGLSIGIKWPNDVLLNQKKVCGILLENHGQAKDGRLRLIVGIGINLLHHPDPADSNWPPTSIAAETGFEPSFDSSLEILIGAVQTRLNAEKQFGFARTRENWLKHAVRLGETIVVRLIDKEWHGMFRDIDDTGALVLETSSGVRKITAGDVFFPEATACS